MITYRKSVYKFIEWVYIANMGCITLLNESVYQICYWMSIYGWVSPVANVCIQMLLNEYI